MDTVTVVLHWLYQDDGGLVHSNGIPAFGIEPSRWTLACRPLRNTVKGMHASDNASLVNCPECQKVIEKRNAAAANPVVSAEIHPDVERLFS